MKNIHRINGNIYITNDEEIKEGDWVVESTTSPRNPYIGKTFYPKNDGTVTEEDLKKYLLSVNYKDHYETIAHKDTCSKIILTTDPDLIKDGVQVIPDEFLEGFVKNPSCEFVDVEHSYVAIKVGKPSPKVYKIITPKEEPKQETLEEVATKEGLYRASQHNFNRAQAGYNAKWFKRGAIFGAKWQQQQNNNLYSEEEVLNLFKKYQNSFPLHRNVQVLDREFNEWFEQFKKK